jgi:hypothetical protein
MKDCMTFLKLQEAVGHKQAETRSKDTTETRAMTSSKSASNKRSRTRAESAKLVKQK